ncbi:MAG: SIR2 family protein, partial [Candidatus Marsarchaeota archaeon]|nr:SIR2 family protein [Candidatus Marsarchaeota archaeon]
MSLTDLADALDPRVHPDDERVSQASLIKLRTLISGPDRSLVFFVGAGASSAGSTGMPTTPQLLRALLSRALKHSGAVYPEKYVDLKRMLFASLNNPPGFEITLNDLLQICPNALKSFFKGFAVLERRCTPNSAHQFLAYWLVTGGTVVTTNYDRLIERALAVNAYQALLRYTESEGPGSFKMWRDDLERGGALFKVHGSLTAPASCLGALEHVGTRLEGSRAELL